MFKVKCFCLLFSFYIVSCKSYPKVAVESADATQEQLEEFVKTYLGGSSQDGSSDNQRLGPFGDVVRKAKDEVLQDNKVEGIGTSPISTTPRVDNDINRSEGGMSPGLMNFNVDGFNDMTKKSPIQPKEAINQNPTTTPQPPTTTTTIQPRQPQPPMDTSNTIRKKNSLGGVIDRPVLVTDEEMRILFINSGKGSSVMIPGCDLAHFHIKSRCSGNLLELTVLSRNPLQGQVRLLEGDGQVNMEGTNLVAYGILGPLTPSGNLWKLKKQVFKTDLNRDCYSCDNMNVRVVMQVGESTCGMAVSCQQKGSSRIVSMEDKFVNSQGGVFSSNPVKLADATTPASQDKPGSPGSQGGAETPVQDPGNTAKTTMSLTYSQTNTDMGGMLVSGMVPLGTRMSLVLSVFSRDVTLDLHVVKCQAKGDDGRGVMLVKDGCSVSSAMGEFREVLNIVQESSFGSFSVRRVSQFAEMRTFNFRRSPQNITLICTIKMCGGECTERPSCVNSEINQGRSNRPPVPIFTQEVTLGKVFYAGGLPPSPSSDMKDLMLDTEPKNNQPNINNDDCISRKTVMILLGFVTCAYLGFLLFCIYCVRRKAAIKVKELYMEDYESPRKSLYSEYNSPRRRTPQTSPEHTTFTINSEDGSSPNLRNMST